MKKPLKTAKKSLLEKMKELSQKHGVKVTDMSERGVRAIGIIGSIKIKTPQQSNADCAGHNALLKCSLETSNGGEHNSEDATPDSNRPDVRSSRHRSRQITR